MDARSVSVDAPEEKADVALENAEEKEGKTNAAMAVMPTRTAIRDAISVYVNTLSYQRALCVGDARYDLSGNPVGVIDAMQKEHAEQRCANKEAARMVRTEKRQSYRERLNISAKEAHSLQLAQRELQQELMNECV